MLEANAGKCWGNVGANKGECWADVGANEGERRCDVRREGNANDGAMLGRMKVSVGNVGASKVCLFCLLVAYRPSNMQVYLRDGSAQTILRAATLR